MTLEVVSPRVRGFICTNAHPAGCAASVAEQVGRARSEAVAAAKGGTALVVGASTGYGLASWITSAFAWRRKTLGVCLECPEGDKRTATAGYYNAAALLRHAREAGLSASAVNGDAFSNAVRNGVVDRLKQDKTAIDLFVYSLASPVRVHPDDGRTIRSALKPVGTTYTTRTIDLDRGLLSEVTLDPASDQEIADTVAVMGGDDLNRWVETLLSAGLLVERGRR